MKTMEPLTAKQREILQWVEGCVEKRGIPPSIPEIQVRFQFKSPTTANDHLNALAKKGYIRRYPEISRGIELLHKKPVSNRGALVPILGQIAAGTPLLAEENLEDYILLDKMFLQGKNHFLLRVKGDSMKNAGIHEGDFVLVRMQNQVERGEIAVAYFNGEATVKRVFPRKGGVELRPENEAYEPRVVKLEEAPDFRILGKVQAVLRLL